MQIQAEALLQIVRRIFEAAGSSPEEAGKIAARLIEANLCGHDSHGVIRVQQYAGFVREGKVIPNQSAEVVSDSEAIVVLDGKRGFGQVMAEQAMTADAWRRLAELATTPGDFPAAMFPGAVRVEADGDTGRETGSAERSPIDITLYNIPMFASPIDVPTIRRLVELPRIVAIKDSSGDMTFMLRMMAAVQPVRPDFSFLCGWEAALVPMLVMGCDGGTNATSGVLPEIMRQLYELTLAGELEAARGLQLRLLEFFDLMVYGADFPEGLRAAVALRGFNMGPSRQPASPSQRIDRAAMQKVMQCIIADFGYTSPPPERCAPRGGGRGDGEQDRISQIAEGVIAKLKERGVV